MVSVNRMEKKQPKAAEAPSGRTGIPKAVQAKFETASGLSFEDVRVHYNSSRPAQLGAYAYTRGSQVYIGPGQERYLEHELGHVVQQKRGLVKPDGYINGLPVNRDPKLERAADAGANQPVQGVFKSGDGIVQMGKKRKRRRGAPVWPASAPPVPTPPAPVPPVPAASTPATQVIDENKSYTSPGGIVYGIGSVHGTRLKHVLEHTHADPSKPKHSVFKEKDIKKLVDLIDEAWGRKGAGIPQSNGNTKYVINMGREIGDSHETSIVVVVTTGTQNLVSAFPEA